MGRNIAEFVYIGRKSCGCVVAACCDMGNKQTAADVAEFIKSGAPFPEERMVKYDRLSGIEKDILKR